MFWALSYWEPSQESNSIRRVYILGLIMVRDLITTYPITTAWPKNNLRYQVTARTSKDAHHYYHEPTKTYPTVAHQAWLLTVIETGMLSMGMCQGTARKMIQKKLISNISSSIVYLQKYMMKILWRLSILQLIESN